MLYGNLITEVQHWNTETKHKTVYDKNMFLEAGNTPTANKKQQDHDLAWKQTLLGIKKSIEVVIN